MARIERRLGVDGADELGHDRAFALGYHRAAEDPSRAAELSGRPALGLDLLLTDAEGAPLPQQRGAEGHLRVRGAGRDRALFGPRGEARTDADGWFPTGDLARIDAKGNLVITGRAKDLIKSGGEWINPAQIEAIVRAPRRSHSPR